MKTFLLTLTYLVGMGELILAIYFWVTNSKNEIRKVMALLALSTGLWVVTTALTAYTSQNTLTTVYMRILFASGAVLVTSLLHVSLVYPFQLQTLNKLHGWLLYGPAILWASISFFSNGIVSSFFGSLTDSGRIVPGPVYTLYNIYIFVVYIIAIYVFYFRRKKTDGRHRKNVSLIAFSVFLGGMPAVLIDLLVPVFTKGIYPNALYGAISTIVWLGVTTMIVNTNE